MNSYTCFSLCVFLFIAPQAFSSSGDIKVSKNITLTNCRLERSHKASLYEQAYL